MREGPVRTCLGCREVKPKRWLVRLVRTAEGVVKADAAGSAAGRGAYVCARGECLERALSRGRLAHAFRGPCRAGADLAEEVRGLWQQQK